MFPTTGTTGPEWTLVYTSSTSIGAIVGGSTSASVVIMLSIIVIPLLIVIYILKKRLKEKIEK